MNFANASTTHPPVTLSFGDIGNTTLNRALVTITCLLSLLGASIIIITYVEWKNMRSTSRRILVYISIADSIVAASYIFGAYLPQNTNSNACTTQSFISTTANLWSFFWTLFMAIFLYTTIAMQKPSTALKMFWMYHGIGWGVPVFVVSFALFEGVLGNDRDIFSSAWCWIKVQGSGKSTQHHSYIIWMLVTGKAWEILVFVLILIFYGLLKWHLREELHRNERHRIRSNALNAAKRADKRLTFVPVIFLILRSCGMLRFCIYISSSEEELKSTKTLNIQEVLVYLQGICESAQGFANFIFFCLLTKKFQENSRRLLYRHCPCLEEIWEYDATIEPTDQSINPADGYNILDLESTEMNETVTLSRTSNLNANYLAIT